MKQCSRCKTNKNDIEFSFKNKDKNIRQIVCKECHKTYVKDHYIKNKDSYLERANKSNSTYTIRNKENLIDFLKDKKCIDCGEDDIRTLEFDHIDPVSKHRAVSELVVNSYSWKSILIEIEKCEIRCANCHRKKTVMQFETYRSKGFKNER